MPRPTTPNVLRIFRAATPDEIAEGREWYARARTLAVELDPDDIERAAAVIAVLSPRQAWSRNVELSRLAYDLARKSAEWTHTSARDEIVGNLPTLGRQREQVARLLVDREEPDDVVRGPKVRAFWRTIADPTDPRAVVVDRHAVDVACGEVLDDARRGKILGRRGGYDLVSRCYSRAAREVGMTPAEVQAITWHVWRRHHARATSANVHERRAVSVTVGDAVSLPVDGRPAIVVDVTDGLATIRVDGSTETAYYPADSYPVD